MNFATFLAATTAPAATPVEPPGWFQFFRQATPFLLIGLAFIAMTAFGGKGKRADEKQRQAMLKALKRGDKIQTIGGIQGTVVTVEEKRVSVKVDETKDTKMWFARTAIAQVLVETVAGDKVVDAK